ncbi:uncharacterized protein, partial [Penaeus vannamei]
RGGREEGGEEGRERGRGKKGGGKERKQVKGEKNIVWSR